MEVLSLAIIGLFLGYLLTIHAGVVIAILVFIAICLLLNYKFEGLEVFLYAPGVIAYMVGFLIGLTVLFSVGGYSLSALLLTIFVP